MTQPVSNASSQFSVTDNWNHAVGKLATWTGSELLVKCLDLKPDASTAYKVFVIGLTVLTGIVTIPLLILSYEGMSKFASWAASSIRNNQASAPAAQPQQNLAASQEGAEQTAAANASEAKKTSNEPEAASQDVNKPAKADDAVNNEAAPKDDDSDTKEAKAASEAADAPKEPEDNAAVNE